MCHKQRIRKLNMTDVTQEISSQDLNPILFLQRQPVTLSAVLPLRSTCAQGSSHDIFCHLLHQGDCSERRDDNQSVVSSYG